LANEWKQGKRERSPESAVASPHHKRNKRSPSVESIGLFSITHRARRSNPTQTHQYTAPVNNTPGAFGDWKFDESLAFTLYMCAFDVPHARLTAKLPYASLQGQTVICAGGSSLPAIDDNDLVSAIAILVEANM